MGAARGRGSGVQSCRVLGGGPQVRTLGGSAPSPGWGGGARGGSRPRRSRSPFLGRGCSRAIKGGVGRALASGRGPGSGRSPRGWGPPAGDARGPGRALPKLRRPWKGPGCSLHPWVLGSVVLMGQAGAPAMPVLLEPWVGARCHGPKCALWGWGAGGAPLRHRPHPRAVMLRGTQGVRG